jgi:hypothetical protein
MGTFDMWDTELTEQEEEELLRKAATEIRRRKLVTPAILALESHKPLANTLAHGALVFSGFLVPFFGFQNVNDYSRLLKKRENFERLIVLLEESEGTEGSSANEVKDHEEA